MPEFITKTDRPLKVESRQADGVHYVEISDPADPDRPVKSLYEGPSAADAAAEYNNVRDHYKLRESKPPVRDSQGNITDHGAVYTPTRAARESAARWWKRRQ